MGLRNSRPLPLANAELEMAPFFKRRFRTWHLDHVALVMERYRALTMRHCVDAIQLSAILGIKDQAFIQEIMRLFQPKTPTRVHHMVDAMEIVLALILVCQAPSMKHRFEAIFDVIDLNSQGVITPADLVLVFGAFARTVMKLFRYTVEPNQRDAMLYINTVLESGIASTGSIERTALSKLMLTDKYAVHYTKQCTGEAKHKLYFLLEKDAAFLGAIEFHTQAEMKAASLKTIREMARAQLYHLPSEFSFLCQGREVQHVWEVDRKAWSIVPFAMRGSPGLRVHAQARNRRTECPRRTNPFEFRYMGNTLARYKKKVSEISPVYKHRGFKIAAGTGGKPLACVVRWRVAENWSGEWVYDQPTLAATSKSLLQKRLRNAPRAKAERVAVKTHRGELISPWGANDEVAGESRPGTSAEANQQSVLMVVKPPALNTPAAIAQKRLDREARTKKIKWKSRVIAMNALQQSDVEPQEDADGVEDKENESRRANRTKSVEKSVRKPETKGSTVLVHVQEGRQGQPSRLLLPASNSGVDKTPSSLRVQVIKQKLELCTPSTLSSGDISLGPFLSSSNIELEEDEVEVFPVIVIRPHGCLVDITEPEDNNDCEPVVEGEPVPPTERAKLWVDPSFLSEYEFDVSRTESNFEYIYHHIYETSMDLITLNRRDVFGRTMLHDAAEHGHSNLLELLLKQRVLRNVGDWRGDTPLHHAARRGHLKELSALLRERAAPWQLNNEGKSPLFCALEAAAKRMRRSAVSHKRPPQRWTASSAVGGNNDKNFLATSDAYPRMRQVIDLLWDRYPTSVLTQPDNYDRTTCLILEQQVFGDLFQACRDGNLVRVQRLIDLEKRAPPLYVNERLDTLGRTILHEATEQGHTAVVDLLLKVGADGYIADQRLQLPLHIAADKGHERITKCVLHKCPSSVQAQDCVGKTPLHLATERNHTAVAVMLIATIRELWPSVLDVQDAHGYTALHYAAIYGNAVVCRALVEAGAAPMVSRFETTVDGRRRHCLGLFWKRSRAQLADRRSHTVTFDVDTPAEILLRSARSSSVRGYQERLQILRLLVPLASNQNQSIKRTPQMLYHLAVDLAASNLGFAVDVCKALSEVKYEVNLVHHETLDSALLYECKRVCRRKTSSTETLQDDDDPSSLALVRTMIQVGANVNLPNERTGETPLSCAAWYGHLALLDLLLDAGADCNYFPRNSFSSLHFATLGGHVACAKMLLSHKADINVHRLTPKQDEGPLFFAIRSKNEAMVALLLERGGDPCALCTLQQGVVTSYGITLSIATDKRHAKKKKKKAVVQRMPTIGPGKELIDDGVVGIASPLTLALLLAKELHAFASSAETTGVARAQRRREWEAMRAIAWTVAQHAMATTTPSGSAGSSLITRNDVDVACVLGYWELAKLLLAQQVMLPNASTSSQLNALHLAAAAGETSVVIALVAAGANVNCRVDQGPLHWSVERATDPQHTLQVAGTRNCGALYFALIHGHVETATKLLVLGAKPLDTLPHSIILCRRTKPVEGDPEGGTARQHVKLYVHERMPKRINDVFFQGARRLRVSESPTSQEYHHERVASNFVTHLECSINAQVPLLHYAAGMGYTSLVQLLVDAGMSMTAPPVVDEEERRRPSLCRFEWRADTAIHVAIACGHVGVVRFFASQAQFNFPRHFQREGKKPESLLVAACMAKRVDILRYLLSGGSADEDGGGYNIHDTHDDVQRALNCCAREHFVDGFVVLLRARARPDLSTLVMVVENINWTEKRRGGRSGSVDCGQLPPDTSSSTSVSVRRRTRDKSRLLSDAKLLLDAIAQPAKHFDQFFNVLSFDHLLTVFIVCSQYELWRVFHEVFLVNEPHFAAPLNPWKPLLVRAASCCMVLHRAAKANQDLVLRFFLRLGVPADLRLSEFPTLAAPIRFAAEHGALRAFLALALNSSNLADALGIHRSLPHIHFRTIASSTSWFSSTSTRRWQNMSAMSCYDISRSRSDAHFVQKLVQLLVLETKQPAGNTLLHVACSRADPVLVELLLAAGASDQLLTENAARVTPLMAAASRKDAFGATIVRLLVATGKTQQAPESVKQRWVSRALAACYAQPPPCNLRIAKILLAAEADVDFEDEPTLSSPLRYALRTVQFAAVKLLLDHGAKLSLSLVETFLTPLQVRADNLTTHWRTFASFLKTRGLRLLDVESVMTLLLEKKYTLSCWNENLYHQLLTAAASIAATTAKRSEQEKKFWAISQRILEHHGDAIASRKTVWGHKTALHYAVQSLETSIVQQLVDVCAFEVDAEDESKRTPLHLVAINGDAGICRLLLEKLRDKSRVDCVDIQGRTPLHLAVIHGHDAVVAQLLRAGASLHVRCNRDYNAHLYAAASNNVAILMALFDKDQSRGLLHSSSGEFGVFLAAQRAAFRVVRWFETVYEAMAPTTDEDSPVAFYTLTCHRNQRTLLHYAATFGDLDTVKRILSLPLASAVVNARDLAGYTPLMYAFAFGKLSVVELLLQAGADPELTVDHSGEAKTHPYACSFSLAAFSKWVALPGWFSFVASQFSPQDKRCLTSSFLTEEHYLLASAYRRRRVQPPVAVGRYSRLPLTTARNTVVRSTLRTWKFPAVSLFAFACEVGDQNVLALVARMPLPGVVSSAASSYGVLRRAFLQAVQWNRVDIVKLLLSDHATALLRSASASKASDLQFSDFLEEAVDRAVSRGLQEMTVLLLSNWRGIKENGRTGADANAFAFQFAQVFQVACIRNLVDVVTYMISRGGEQIVAFHWNEGPSLAYAFAFGHTQLASLLLDHGAHISTMDTYVAPSFKKWIEFGCPEQVHVQWYETFAAQQQQPAASRARAFVGPLEVYAPQDERLDREMMAELFLPEAATEDVTLTIE